MNRSLLYSGALHAVLFLLVMAFMSAPAHKTKAVYTIDFIGGSSVPMRYGEPEQSGGASVPEPVKTEDQPAAQPPENKESPITAQPAQETAKPAKPKYNSEEQISEKPKKETKEEKVVLSKPSVLGDVQSNNITASALSGGAGSGSGVNSVKANFTNFPYPWYITQVRNGLWREWSKRMPNVRGFKTAISFNIDRYGAVYGVQVEESSGNDSYDYAAMSAVNNSAPYPPLPKDFGKDILTVTVEFKNEEE